MEKWTNLGILALVALVAIVGVVGLLTNNSSVGDISASDYLSEGDVVGQALRSATTDFVDEKGSIVSKEKGSVSDSLFYFSFSDAVNFPPEMGSGSWQILYYHYQGLEMTFDIVSQSNLDVADCVVEETSPGLMEVACSFQGDLLGESEIVISATDGLTTEYETSIISFHPDCSNLEIDFTLGDHYLGRDTYVYVDLLNDYNPNGNYELIYDGSEFCLDVIEFDVELFETDPQVLSSCSINDENILICEFTGDTTYWQEVLRLGARFYDEPFEWVVAGVEIGEGLAAGQIEFRNLPTVFEVSVDNSQFVLPNLLDYACLRMNSDPDVCISYEGLPAGKRFYFDMSETILTDPSLLDCALPEDGSQVECDVVGVVGETQVAVDVWAGLRLVSRVAGSPAIFNVSIVSGLSFDDALPTSFEADLEDETSVLVDLADYVVDGVSSLTFSVQEQSDTSVADCSIVSDSVVSCDLFSVGDTSLTVQVIDASSSSAQETLDLSVFFDGVLACTDSDGYDIHTKGMVSLNNGEMYRDTCIDGVTVGEGVCGPPEEIKPDITVMEVDCLPGEVCVDGVCRS